MVSSPMNVLSAPSCTVFVYPECWHFGNGASSKIDDVLAKDDGLLHVLPITIHLKIFDRQVGGVGLDWVGVGSFWCGD